MTRFKHVRIREKGIEPQLPTGPMIAQSGKKKNVANSHDVNTRLARENIRRMCFEQPMSSTY
jgi:hypothetical protein